MRPTLHRAVLPAGTPDRATDFFGLTAEGVHAAIEGALTVTSRNPGVLSVEQLPDGTFQFTVVALGTATVDVSGEDASGNPITTTFVYSVYDPTELANHFDETIVSQALRVVPAPVAATGTVDPAAAGTAA